jgi:Putative Actinobacterial Holin-X, holin superfamily III
VSAEQRPGGEVPQNIAAAIADVSERASVLVREEIELAKAEVTEKATKLVKGAIVGVAAGVFF